MQATSGSYNAVSKSSFQINSGMETTIRTAALMPVKLVSGKDAIIDASNSIRIHSGKSSTSFSTGNDFKLFGGALTIISSEKEQVYTGLKNVALQSKTGTTLKTSSNFELTAYPRFAGCCRRVEKIVVWSTSVRRQAFVRHVPTGYKARPYLSVAFHRTAFAGHVPKAQTACQQFFP